MIEPKYDLRARNNYKEKLKIFVDRREFISEVKNKFLAIRNSKIEERSVTVINFHGVAGIGKTSLVEKLKNIVEEAEGVYFGYDFEGSPYVQFSDVLLRLRTSCSSKKINFLNFDIAYAMYFRKKYPRFTLENKKLPFIEDASFIGQALSLIDGWGAASLVTGVIDKIYKVCKSNILASKEIKEELTKLKSMSLMEIEDVLPLFFCYDLKQNVMQAKECPVFFLDTYEIVFGRGYNVHEGHGVDDAVKSFVASLPFCMFVIAGREKINWVIEDNDWDDHISSYELSELGFDDCKELLTAAGIEEKETVFNIFSASEGHPYYISLCVYTYFEMRAKGDDIKQAKFFKGKRDIFNKFIRSVPSGYVDLLKILSVPSYFDFDMFMSCINYFHLAVTKLDYERLKTYSFVKELKNKCHFHKLFKKSLVETFDEGNLELTEGYFLNYFSEKLKRDSFYDNINDVSVWLSEAFRQVKELYDQRKALVWIKDVACIPIKHLQLNGNTKVLLGFFKEVFEFYPGAVANLEIFYVYIDMIHLRGGFEAAVALLESELDKFDFNTISSSDNLSYLFIRHIHHKTLYRSLEKYKEKVLELMKVREGKSDRVLNEIYFMLGGHFGGLDGFSKIERLYIKKSIDISIDIGDVEMLVRSLRKYGDCLRLYGHYTCSGNFFTYATILAEKNNMSRYVLYLKCAKADLLRMQHKYQESIDGFIDAREMAVSNDVESWIGHSHLGEAFSLLGLKEVELCQSNLNSAELYYKRTGLSWGLVYVKLCTARLMKELANDGYSMVAMEGRKMAKKYGYRYCVDAFDKLMSDEKYVDCLMFL